MSSTVLLHLHANQVIPQQATEREQDFRNYFTCKWMAKSPNVATKDFRQVTDSLFEKAVQQASAKGGNAPLSAD